MTKVHVLILVLVALNAIGSIAIWAIQPSPSAMTAIADNAIRQREAELVKKYGGRIVQIQTDLGMKNVSEPQSLEELMDAIASIVLMPQQNQ